VFPEAYRRFAASVRGPGPYVVTGKVEDHLGAISVTAERIDRAQDQALSAQLSAPEAHS